jgi:hypothetical protein
MTIKNNHNNLGQTRKTQNLQRNSNLVRQEKEAEVSAHHNNQQLKTNKNKKMNLRVSKINNLIII